MTNNQERAITLALNMLHVGFFECTRHAYEYFVTNDEWALLMTAAGINVVGTPPAEVALATLRNAVRREGFFAGMADFEPPAHYCSFLSEQVRRGERTMTLRQCEPGQRGCPFATFENLKDSRLPNVADTPGL